MGLSSWLLVIAFTAGLGGAAAGLAARRNSEVDVGSIAASGLTIVGLFLTATVIGGRAGSLEFFGVVHLAYLMVTVAVPSAACALLIGGRFRGIAKGAIPVGLLTLGALLAPLGLYASHIEPFWLRIDRAVVQVDTSVPLRIGVLSDVQAPEIGRYENDAVDRLLAENPDVVLIPGDLFQSPTGEPLGEAAKSFRELLARLGTAVPHVYAVEGDADFISGLKNLADGTGVVVLYDEVGYLEVQGQHVVIAGLGQNKGKEHKWKAPLDALAEAPEEALRIVLAHRPGVVDSLDRIEVDLVVAGHTHGGQVALPFLGPPFVLSDMPRHVAAGGLHDVRGTMIYVSTGVGRERGQAPQVRFLVRPSIGVIDVE